jgi:hypothetical protein
MTETTTDPHGCTCKAPYPHLVNRGPREYIAHAFTCPLGRASGLMCNEHFDMRGSALNWMVDECDECQRVQREEHDKELALSMTCEYCGATDGPYRMHSGVYECDSCWNWRKLDSGATRYWYIISRVALSSVDTYDLTRYFPTTLGWPVADINTFLRLLKQLQDKTGELAEAHEVDKRWKAQTQALFDKLRGA